MRPKLTARAEKSLLLRHDPAPREMTLRIEPAATGLRPRLVPTPARCGQLPKPPLPRGAGVDRCLPRRRREPGSDSRLVDLSSGTGLMAATSPWPSSAVDRYLQDTAQVPKAPRGEMEWTSFDFGIKSDNTRLVEAGDRG